MWNNLSIKRVWFLGLKGQVICKLCGDGSLTHIREMIYGALLNMNTKLKVPWEVLVARWPVKTAELNQTQGFSTISRVVCIEWHRNIKWPIWTSHFTSAELSRSPCMHVKCYDWKQHKLVKYVSFVHQNMLMFFCFS